MLLCGAGGRSCHSATLGYSERTREENYEAARTVFLLYFCHAVKNLLGSYKEIISFQSQCSSADLGLTGRFRGKVDCCNYEVENFVWVKKCIFCSTLVMIFHFKAVPQGLKLLYERSLDQHITCK